MLKIRQFNEDDAVERLEIARRVRANVLPKVGEIHCWIWWNDGSKSDYDRLVGLLSPDERERARRFHFVRDRRRYVGCRGGLRELLAAYSGSDPKALVFQYGERGKPYLAGAGGELSFNVSHSGDFACVAMGSGVNLGVDIEERRSFESLLGVAKYCMSEADVELLQQLPEKTALEQFYRIWTSKEAVLKATGDGLVDDLPGVPCLDAGKACGVTTVFWKAKQARFALHALLGLPEGFAGALAVWLNPPTGVRL